MMFSERKNELSSNYQFLQYIQNLLQSSLNISVFNIHSFSVFGFKDWGFLIN